MRRMSRRVWMATTVAGLYTILTGSTTRGSSTSSQKDEEKEHPVTPAEDLMFEHGVLERLLLIYAETIRRIESGGQFPVKLLSDTAGLFRRFGEDYHEKLEEQHIFPVLEKKNQHAELARELKTQHDAGRKITTSLIEMTKGGTLAQPQQAAQALASFYRMYIPHISRENSVAFRAFHEIVPQEQYQDLGEQFEAKERELFGEDGFQRVVEQVTVIEKDLGIDNIAKVTPR
ncbi:MAG: hemerythrin domain-containing protein [Solirubrobacterales bacterium]